MAKRRKVRWDRVIIVFVPLLLLLILFVKCVGGGSEKPKTSTDSSSVVAEVTETTTTAITDGIATELTETVTTVQTEEAVPAAITKKELVVVIDPGHGGEDDGALDNVNSPTRFEKNDNLQLAIEVQKAFQKYPNIKTVMTRTEDVFVSLNDRCRIANDINADFFISLHRNSAVNGDGVEIWINNDALGDNSMDKLLAQYIMELLDEVGISKNRGIKSGFRNSTQNEQGNNYYVNRNTTMPSCLIEMGFMSSVADNSNFDNNCQKYGEAIAKAVVELVTDRRIMEVQIMP